MQLSPPLLKDPHGGKKRTVSIAGVVIFTLLLQVCFLIPFVNDIQYILFLLLETIVIICISLSSSSPFLTLLLLVPIFIDAAQYASLYSTGNYLIPLTLLNIHYSQDLGNQLIIIIAIFVIYLSVAYINIVLLGTLRFSSRVLSAGAILGYASIAIMSFIFYNSQLTWKKYPFPTENALYISYKTIKLLLSAPKDTYAETFKKTLISGNFKNLIAEKEFKDYNVIIIFLEGTSSALLSDTLTPNIKALQEKSLNIVNYYNHTAATFRGLRGQFISGYSLKGGREYAGDLQGVAEWAQLGSPAGKGAPRIESLPFILEQHGYTTVFISPHDNNDKLAPVMAELGFQKVLTAENSGETFSSSLTDRQSYQFLWKEALKLKASGKPFFLCLYQLGTHHGMDSPDKKFGDGSDSNLNKFYNADFWLGEFVDKFLSDSISTTTLLIITSDHATFPAPWYQKAVDPSAQYFVDKIPFLVFGKDIPAKTFDAGYKNSLSFAPTILDILGISSVETHFLGDSLFNADTQNPFSSISCIGYECWHTGGGGAPD